ncbi:MAG: hypothetical protein AMXMBFR84_03890 [Candidatus Hydrogenedentota bacterium]
MKNVWILIGLVLGLAVIAPAQERLRSASLVVATRDSSVKAKEAADYIGDGEGDQEEINRAIQSLPPAGGTVTLMEGTYDIRKVEGALGGVIIDRSYVTLEGQGAATKLVLGPEQSTNVIRIIGSGVGHITLRDLWVDQNRDQNPYGEGDPNVSHARFEFCGIKAFYTHPGGPTGERNHNITIENCHVLDARRLGIMLEGSNMRVINNRLGNAESDSVEILTGPGIISGNFVEITGRTHVGIGSDRGNNILMSNNIIHVMPTGDIDIGFRSWAESERHVIANNVIMIEEGGKLGAAMDIRGYGAVVTGNNIRGPKEGDRLPLNISGGNTLVTANIFERVTVVIHDETEAQKPIVINNNILDDSTIDHRKGNLSTADGH